MRLGLGCARLTAIAALVGAAVGVENWGSAIVTTLAGGGSTGGTASGHTDGTGTAAMFYDPVGVSADSLGHIFVSGYSTIREINTSSAVVTTLAGGAGGSTSGFADGTGIAALFNSPTATTADAAGNLWVVEWYGMRIRRVVVRTGVTTTLAGPLGGSGSLNSGYIDGVGTNAMFSYPFGVTINTAGTTLYVADSGNNVIRGFDIASATVSTFAGSGTSGFVDGVGIAALFSNPNGIAADAGGNLFVTDMSNAAIRQIVISTKAVTTLAGGSSGYTDGLGVAASFANPKYVAFDQSGSLLVTDGDNIIRQVIIGTGLVTTAAGGGSVGGTASGFADGTGTAAKFNYLSGIVVDSAGQNAYVADYNNNVVRHLALPTASATSSVSITASVSVTASASVTASVSLTASVSVTASASVSASSSTSASSSLTASTSPSSTVSNTDSISSTQTSTPSQTASQTSTPTETQTPTGTGTQTPSLSSTKTGSGTGSQTQTGTSTASNTGSNTATNSPTDSGTSSVTASGTGTASETGTLTPLTTGTGTGTPGRTHSVTPSHSRSASVSASAVSTPSTTATNPGPAAAAAAAAAQNPVDATTGLTQGSLASAVAGGVGGGVAVLVAAAALGCVVMARRRRIIASGSSGAAATPVASSGRLLPAAGVDLDAQPAGAGSAV